MTSQQIGQWLAFDAIEPIGRDWERTGMQTSFQCVQAGGKEFDASAFLPAPIEPPAEEEQ